MLTRYVRVLTLFSGLLLSATAAYPQTEPVIGAMYHHWYWPERWSAPHPYHPVLGAYDSANAATVRQHVAWAREAGINTFAIDTWITDEEQGWMTRNTPPLVNILDETGIKYFFFADGWFNVKDAAGKYNNPQAIASKVNAYLAPYFSRSGYMRVDGKPVVFFWASDPTTCDLWKNVRSGIEGTSGPVYMVGFSNNGTCFDRQLYYNPYSPTATTHEQQLAHQDRFWADWQRRGFSWGATATPGYNDTLVRAGNPAIPLNAEYFRKSLRTAMKYDQRSSRRWLFVCSFNEWWEGSIIEPNTTFASDSKVFLRAMREELTAAGWLSSPASTHNRIRVQHAYRGILGREADPGGLASHASMLDAGQPVYNVCRSLFNSPEYAQNRGGLSATALAVELYRGILERTASPQEIQVQANNITNGLRIDVAANMITSPEFQQRFLP